MYALYGRSRIINNIISLITTSEIQYEYIGQIIIHSSVFIFTCRWVFVDPLMFGSILKLLPWASYNTVLIINQQCTVFPRAKFTLSAYNGNHHTSQQNVNEYTWQFSIQEVIIEGKKTCLYDNTGSYNWREEDLLVWYLLSLNNWHESSSPTLVYYVMDLWNRA